MTQGDWAVWLPLALLLLWVPGCFSLSGPSTVNGTVGGSLSVQCRYEEEYRTNNKYWCREPIILLCDKIAETKKSERKARGSRVSIRDHPENFSFTVTMKNLMVEDTGTYWCGIDTPWHSMKRDPILQVEVSVFPVPTSMTPTSMSFPVAETSTVTTEVPAALSTSLATVSATHNTNIQDDFQQGPDPRLPLLLFLLALLLLLLVGTSLLAWRMFQKRGKAGKHSEPSQSPRQAAEQSEPHYANLELQTCPLWKEPVPPRQAEMEYSTVAAPREDLHYSSVVFDVQSRDSNASRSPSQRPREEEPEYSVIKKT
ncbi:CMRF35-like molecule 8 [Cynocephalus volans]|uniref:CMRF35-like molecule 8 n=1 Tax=Cynocephalus volans TaxID=110931 RepID=UPI002FCC51D9